MVHSKELRAERALDEEISPELSAHQDAIYLDERLYGRLAGVDLKAMDGEDHRLADPNRRRGGEGI